MENILKKINKYQIKTIEEYNLIFSSIKELKQVPTGSFYTNNSNIVGSLNLRVSNHYNKNYNYSQIIFESNGFYIKIPDFLKLETQKYFSGRNYQSYQYNDNKFLLNYLINGAVNFSEKDKYIFNKLLCTN